MLVYIAVVRACPVLAPLYRIVTHTSSLVFGLGAVPPKCNPLAYSRQLLSGAAPEQVQKGLDDLLGAFYEI